MDPSSNERRLVAASKPKPSVPATVVEIVDRTRLSVKSTETRITEEVELARQIRSRQKSPTTMKNAPRSELARSKSDERKKTSSTSDVYRPLSDESSSTSKRHASELKAEQVGTDQRQGTVSSTMKLVTPRENQKSYSKGSTQQGWGSRKVQHDQHGRERSTRKHILHEKWKVAAWSKAGISTTVLLRDRTTRRSLLFDCGGLGGINPTHMAEADVVLISHAHADHCAGLFAHARSRFAQKNSAKYLIPRDSLDELVKARKAFESLDEHELKMDFVPVVPGDVINLGKGLFVECVPTIHRVPSVGYLLYREEKRLKEEYQNISDDMKADLGRSGIRLSEAVRTLEVSYSGDTTAEGLDPRIFQAELAIVECTFIEDSERRLSQSTQHVLLSDLEQRIAECDFNSECQLLLIHFSARYSSSQILGTVRQAALLKKKTACAVAAFNSDFRALDEDQGIQYSSG